MKKLYITALSFVVATLGFAQVDVTMNGTSVQGSPASTVSVDFTAEEFTNMNSFEGSIQWDPLVAQYSSITWNVALASGTVDESELEMGHLGFDWSSILSVGPTLNSATIIFTIDFLVVGSGGSETDVQTGDSPTVGAYFNGFGWSGAVVTGTAGHITVCGANDQPTPEFSFSADGMEVTFTNESTGPDMTYAWDFGDESGTSEDENPAYTYAEDGIYTVCLTATNGCGSLENCHDVDITGTSVAETGMQAISIYPNPSNGLVNVNNVSMTGETVYIRVMNITGELLISTNLNNVNNTMDFSGLSNGVYFIAMESGSEMITKRIVLNK